MQGSDAWTVTALRQHRADCCGLPIEPGMPHETWAVFEDGRVHRLRAHTPCFDRWRSYRPWGSECIHDVQEDAEWMAFLEVLNWTQGVGDGD